MNPIFLKLGDFLKSRDEIIFAFIFGSQHSGKIHALSDIDIGIYVKDHALSSQEYAYGYVPSLLGTLPQELQNKDIDIVILNDAPILLRHRCIYGGKVLFTKDSRFLTKFKVKTLLEYLDTKPLREKIKKALYGKK